MRTATTKLLLTGLIMLSVGLVAAEDEIQAVDLFEAMDAGQVVAKFIPADAAHANVLITNATDLPLQIHLPEAIAAVPVLAQFGPEFGQNGGGQNAGGGGAQGVGGGFGLGNGGGNQFGGNQFGGNQFGGNQFGRRQGNGMGMGFMRIAPQKTRKLTARTVCLEHGKPDPNPRIAYRMIPIESFTDDAGVAELCRRLGRGEVAPKTAQAAAWHMLSELSWEELASIHRIESRYIGNVKYFNGDDIKRASELVNALRTYYVQGSVDRYARLP